MSRFSTEAQTGPNLTIHSHHSTGDLFEISPLKALEWFDIRNNEITGSFPDVSALTHLTHLFLSSNRISGSFPDTDAPASLMTCAVLPNDLQSLPSKETMDDIKSLAAHCLRQTGAPAAARRDVPTDAPIMLVPTGPETIPAPPADAPSPDVPASAPASPSPPSAGADGAAPAMPQAPVSPPSPHSVLEPGAGGSDEGRPSRGHSSSSPSDASESEDTNTPSARSVGDSKNLVLVDSLPMPSGATGVAPIIVINATSTGAPGATVTANANFTSTITPTSTSTSSKAPVPTIYEPAHRGGNGRGSFEGSGSTGTMSQPFSGASALLAPGRAVVLVLMTVLGASLV